MDQLEQAMANLEQTMAQLRSFPVLVPQTDFTEIDDDRTVQVEVNQAGTISAIKVLNGWEDRIETHQLPDRINQTLARATVRTMGIDPDDDFSNLPGLTDELPAIDGAVQVEVTEEDREAAAAFAEQRYAEFTGMVEYTSNHQEEILEDIQRRFDELDQVLANSPTRTEPKRYYSENRMVSLSGDGGGVGDVQISESWLSGSRSGLTITKCLTEALEQAPQSSSSFADVMNAFKL